MSEQVGGEHEETIDLGTLQRTFTDFQRRTNDLVFSIGQYAQGLEQAEIASEMLVGQTIWLSGRLVSHESQEVKPSRLGAPIRPQQYTVIRAKALAQPDCLTVVDPADTEHDQPLDLLYKTIELFSDDKDPRLKKALRTFERAQARSAVLQQAGVTIEM